MTKILFVLTKDDIGGAQKYIRDLASGLDPQKFSVKVLYGGQDLRFLSNAFYPHFVFFNDILALGELYRFFRREKPDIVHLNSSKAGVVGALAASIYNFTNKLFNSSTPQLKTVFTAHGWVFNPNNNLSYLRRKFYILLHKIAASFQDKIINVSEYDRRLAFDKKIAPAEKLVTIYNGIGHIAFLSKKEARRNLKTIAGCFLDPEGIWIGSVGRLVSEKDYRTLVEAAQLVPNAQFIIFGSGNERSKLERKIKKLNLQNRFFIASGVAPAAPYLKSLDIFILSSIKEGLPYTMLEAMAAELPIIVTRVGGMTEIIEGAAVGEPKRGLVMPPREPEELARAIKHYIDNPLEAKKAAGSANRFLKEHLTLGQMIQATEKFYD